MNRQAIKTCAVLLATAAGLIGVRTALAQTPPTATPPTAFPGDWPNLGAFSNQQNQNGDPLTYNSGKTLLRWMVPFTYQERAVLTLDNTDDATKFFSVAGNVNDAVDDPAYNGGSVTFKNSVNGQSWGAPADPSKEASPSYQLAYRNQYPAPTSPAGYTRRLDLRPSYFFTACTPSAKGSSDPTVPANINDLRTFDWKFTPPAGADRNYAIYVYLPVGSTDTSPTATPTPSLRKFPQEFYVYKVFFGPTDPATGVGKYSYTDVVDTYQAGSGFIRLGNAGSATDRVFPFATYNGVQYPVTVRLYNTMPRYDDGRLAVPGSTAADSSATEQNLASARLVYADAAQARPQNGSFVASPTAATITATAATDYPDNAANWRVTVARNDYVAGLSGGELTQSTEGVVISYLANPTRWTNPRAPQEAWRYSLVADSAAGNTLDNPSAAASGGWTVQTLNPRYIGANYLDAPVTLANTTTTPPTWPATYETVTYTPTLDNGDYAIYAYLGGSTGTQVYARAVQYLIYQGTTLVDTVTVNQSTNSGWVRIGGSKYTNVKDSPDASAAAPLKVVVTNVSTNGTDGGRKVYADAIRFVSNVTTAVNSTPVHATVAIKKSDGTTAQTQVVIVADEAGKLHCLDLVGNGDGTTTEYWTYPSTPDPVQGTSWLDPNIANGNDGKQNSALPNNSDNRPTATMPSGFDLSTAVVAHVGTNDLLYIGASNGRVYCIDMTGRGDYRKADLYPGTTQRRWTFPDDYNPADPTLPIGSSALGQFRGSIVFGDTNQGLAAPTVFVPAAQGRVYALDAAGNTTTTTTTVKWRYPEATLPTMPSLSATPTLFKSTAGNPLLFFGTDRDANDDTGGRFYCLDATSGNIAWRYNGTTNGLDTHDTASTLRYDATVVFKSTPANGYPDNSLITDFGAFVAAPVAVSKATLDAVPASAATGSAPTHVDTVYALNNNGFLYAFNAQTGTPITFSDGTGVHPYATDDLDVLSDGHLAYTVASAYNRSGTRELFPIILVPSNDGRMREAFARVEDYNVFNGYVADGKDFPQPLTSAAVANKSVFLGDVEGAFYALDDKGDTAGNLPTDPLFDPGVNPVIPPNDPSGNAYRHLKIRLVNKLGFNLLRQIDPTTGQGSLTYAQATGDTTYAGPNLDDTNEYNFEWGETAYVLVYGFPYTTQNNATPPQQIAPPQINLTLSVDGQTVRQVQVDSRQFKNPTSSPPVDGDNSKVQDGYAIVPFPFQNAGTTALPPGQGRIEASLSTAALSTGRGQADILQDTRSNAGNNGSRVDFRVANPLAVTVYDPSPATTTHSIGNDYLASDPQNRVNGSPDIPSTPNEIESQLLDSFGMANHGTSVSTKVDIFDRSLMVLLRPEGLSNVRLQRSNLQRQGGTAGIFRRLDPTLYPGFEDLPTQLPNVSLDYPDIPREQLSASAATAATTENPLTTGVTLNPPTALDGSVLTEDKLTNSNERSFVRTTFTLTIDVPRYQPPVDYQKLGAGTPIDNPSDLLDQRHNSVQAILPQGYFGRMQVYVDSTGDGRLNRDTQVEAYRSFNYTTGVSPQIAIRTGTPNVDLGSLAAGTGYSTVAPAGANFVASPTTNFNPWGGSWSGVYQPISVRNDGNVNLLNLRVAKASHDKGFNTTQTVTNLWPLSAADNDPLAWLGAGRLDASKQLVPGDLWSNIDTTFAAPNPNGAGGNSVILAKPRITDRAPTELTANPYPRANPNTGMNGRSHVLNPALAASQSPKVAVSVPLGFPVGNYSSPIRVIEDYYDGTVVGSDSDPVAMANNQILDQFVQTNAFEAYSEPITLTFKVRETRATNRATPNTAPMVDNPGLFPPDTSGIGGDTKVAYRNAAPGAYRTPNGGLVLAWESDRATKVGSPLAVNPSQIFFAAVANGASFTPSGISAPSGNAPLWDLTQFVPSSASQWFTTTAGYPLSSGVNPQDLFGEGTLVTNTADFGSPSFPAAGAVNDLDANRSLFSTTYMGFVGDGQITTGNARIQESKVFLASFAVNGNGNVSAGKPVSVGGDPMTMKGKPSVLQLPTGALVFYSETAAGQSGITVSRLRSTGLPGNMQFTRPVRLNFGDGFSSVFSPSAIVRRYLGANVPSAANPSGTNPQVVELSFAGKLRGRPSAEVFLGRLRLDTAPTAAADPNDYQLVDSALNGRQSIETGRAGSPFVTMPKQTLERLRAEGNGVYRSRGVMWQRVNPQTGLTTIELWETFKDNTNPINLLAGNPQVDGQSGLMSFDSRLGGKVYLDPELGTVRFTGSFPNPNGEVRLTYQPTFLRVSPGGSGGYSAVNGLFDDRYVSEYATDANGAVFYPYWFQQGGTVAQPDPNKPVRNDRFFFAYAKGATGGVTARPYTTTLRIGVRLPSRIATDTNGNILSLQVTGNRGPYQADPANGRIYFDAQDEDNGNIKIAYVGVNEATNAPWPSAENLTAAPSFVLERDESPLLVDQPTNDAAVTAFLDPFTFPSTSTSRFERPPLVWLFYTSTRAGGPDVYFQSIAPRYMPSPK